MKGWQQSDEEVLHGLNCCRHGTVRESIRCLAPGEGTRPTGINFCIRSLLAIALLAVGPIRNSYIRYSVLMGRAAINAFGGTRIAGGNDQLTKV